MDITIDFGLFTLTIRKHEIICIYKHFSKLQKLKISIWHPKGTHFLGAKCNLSLHGEMDITMRFGRIFRGSNPLGETIKNSEQYRVLFFNLNQEPLLLWQVFFLQLFQPAWLLVLKFDLTLFHY